MKLNSFFKALIAVIVCELAGLIGSFFTVSQIPTWYATLQKPALNPPSWIFGPVWTTLYLLMGLSAFIIWKRGLENKNVRNALRVFIFQLILNSIWSVIFFGLENPTCAFVDIVLMWISIVWTMMLFSKISKTATWLLVPYILWVSFAAYLNYSIMVLN